MRIFNSVRKRLLKENKFTRYLAYSIGEIILVVIGIFIGLQANKWNETSIKKTKITSYLSRIEEEIKSTSQLLEYNSELGYNIIEELSSCLVQISNQKIDSSFQEKFKRISENEAQTYFFPVIDEFLEHGYLTSIQDTLLLESFNYLSYNRKQSDIDDKQVKDFHNQIILPRLINKLNFLDIDYMNKEFSVFGSKKMNYPNFRKNDYSEISKDLEIWNLIVYRIDLEKNRIIVNKSLLNTMRNMQKRIGYILGKK